MYHLHRVYATVSFERNKINLLVVEYDKEKMNCLYYNYCDLDYLDDNLHFINHDSLTIKIRNLILDADAFLGLNIKKYIINISCLPFKSNVGKSPEFLVFQDLTLDHANNYISKVLNMNRDENDYALKVFPTVWYLDEQPYVTFPEGEKSKKISFDYISLMASRKIVDQFVDLITEVSGKPLAITCNSLVFGSIANEGIDAALIDIKSNNTIVNVYDKNGEIKNLITINKGAKWYISEVKRILGIDQSANIFPLINALENLIQTNSSTVILHKHYEEFLTIKEGTVASLVTALKLASKRLFTDIEKVLTSLQHKTSANFNKVHINVTESLFKSFKEACPISILSGMPVKLLINNVIGLEDYAVNNMLAAIHYVRDTQTIHQDTHTYSVEPFISQKQINQQLKQSFLMKLGIFSTRWAAKLGE